MPPKAKIEKRYFAQVGSESIEVPAEALEGNLATSAPVLFYRIKATVGETTFEGVGQSWDEASAMVDKQAGVEA